MLINRFINSLTIYNINGLVHSMQKFKFVFPPVNLLNERYIANFGITLKQLLKKMFGGDKVPILVKGNKKQITKGIKLI